MITAHTTKSAFGWIALNAPFAVGLTMEQRVEPDLVWPRCSGRRRRMSERPFVGWPGSGIARYLAKRVSSDLALRSR